MEFRKNSFSSNGEVRLCEEVSLGCRLKKSATINLYKGIY